MRNLKRALSLTLASVMLLGMMVVGSSAAKGYDDVKDTDNVEAIEVLQAIEVMVGDERGFGPERPVNRAEMAVVMGKLLNLDYNYYSTSCPFNDVYDWARGYVGACAANKIVSGRGDGVYDPGATVTAVEAASMLMRALGYFQYANDIADGFELSTVRQGTKIGIFDGVGSSATEPMTRNQVAQMVLNALQSDTVEPDGNTINLTTPDGTVLTGKVNYVSVTRDESWATAIDDTRATSVGSDNNGYIVELGERLYNGKLKLTEDIDVFGRPSRKWEYDGKGIGTYAKKELMDKEYVGKVTGKDLFDLLGSTTLKDYDVYCFVDGLYTDASGAKADLGWTSNTTMGAYFNAADMNKNNKAAVGGTGTGTKTEVYVDHDSDEVFVVVINTYLARAKKDYDAKKEEVGITAYAIEQGRNTKEYVKNASRIADKSVSFDLAVEDFPSVVDIKKDDPLLITVADGEVQTYKPAEVLSGVTVSAFKLQEKVVVDGTTYEYTTTALYKNSDDINKNWTNSTISNLKDRTYNVFLDAYGNLIGIEEVEAKKNYVFITGIDLNGSYRANQTADASAIFLDGTMDSIKVNMTRSEWQVAPKDDYTASLMNTWCTYTKSGDVYTLKEVVLVGKDDNVDSGRPGADYINNDGKTKKNDTGLAQYNHIWYNAEPAYAKIDAKNYRMRGANVTNNSDYYSVYGDSDTVYLTAKLGELITEGPNCGIIKDVASVTTGIENANLTVWDTKTAVSKADDPKVKGTAPVANETSRGVYTLYNDNGVIIAAVVVGEDAGTAKDLVYVSSSKMSLEADNGGSSKAAGDGLWTWSREVIRNGEKVTLYEVGDDSSQPKHLNSMLQYHWYQIRTNGDGNVIESTEVSEALAEYEKGETGASRYVISYDKINDAVETEGVDTVVYLTNGGPTAAGFQDKKLEVKGNNTLAVTDLVGSGIHFKPNDVNVVLVYYNRNIKEMDVWAGEGVDDLKDMVDEVNANNGYRTKDKGQYYYVSALIEGGFATTIVLYDMYNDYDRPGDKDQTGSKETEYYKFNYDSGENGRFRGTITAKRPEWLATGTALNASYDIYVNGSFWDADTIAIGSTARTASDVITDVTVLTSPTVEIKNFKWTDLNDQTYYIKWSVNGKEVAIPDAASTTSLLNNTTVKTVPGFGVTDDAVTAKLGDMYGATADVSWTATGLWDASGSAALTGPTDATAAANVVTVAGDATATDELEDYVRINLTIANSELKPTTYGVKLSEALETSLGATKKAFFSADEANTNATATVINELYALTSPSETADDTLKIVASTSAGGTQKVSEGLAANTRHTINLRATVAQEGSKWDYELGYKITLGTNKGNVVFNVYDGSLTDDQTVELINEDLIINSIRVDRITTPLEISSISFDATKLELTINFNHVVGGSAADSAVAATGAITNTGNMTANAYTHVKGSKSITVKVNGLLANGQTYTIAATSVYNQEHVDPSKDVLAGAINITNNASATGAVAIPGTTGLYYTFAP